MKILSANSVAQMSRNQNGAVFVSLQPAADPTFHSAVSSRRGARRAALRALREFEAAVYEYLAPPRQ